MRKYLSDALGVVNDENPVSSTPDVVDDLDQMHQAAHVPDVLHPDAGVAVLADAA